MICDLIILSLLLAAAPIELVDEVFDIPAEEWRYVEVSLRQQPVTVSAHFTVEQAGGAVRVALVRQDQLARWRAGRKEVVAVSRFAATGTLVERAPGPGEYAVLLENRTPGPRPAKVHLRITLNFGNGRGPEVSYVSPERQLAVIMISFAVFFAIVTFSARKLLRAIKR